MAGPSVSPFGTPLTSIARKILLLGSGELGKEVVIEAQRLGVEVVAVDRYAHAPAMQVAHRSHVIDMRDPAQVRAVVEEEDPDLVVSEIEAIASDRFSLGPSGRTSNLKVVQLEKGSYPH